MYMHYTPNILKLDIKVQKLTTVFQLENEKGRAPGRALCAKWAREGTF